METNIDTNQDDFIKLQYLCMIIRQGWETDVAQYIKLNPSIVDTLHCNVTPILVAIMANKPKIVQLLLDTNIAVNDTRGIATPLMAAVLTNNYVIAEILIQNGANIDYYVYDPCHYPCHYPYPYPCHYPYTPLHAAIELENTSMVLWLTKKFSPSWVLMSTSVMMCAIKTSLTMVSALYGALIEIVNSPSIFLDVVDILICGINENCVETIKMFLNSPFITNAVLDKPLLMNHAISVGNESIMAVLGDHGVVFDI